MYKRQRKHGITPENYIIQQVERAKHFTPAFGEIDIVTKLAYHFNHNIRVAVFTQGIRTVDELLILVSQSETVFDLGGWRYNPDFSRNNEGQNRRVPYHAQPDQRPSTSATPPQTPPKPPNKPFDYKGKPNVGRPKMQNKGDDGTSMRTIQTVDISKNDTTAQESETQNVRDPIEKPKCHQSAKNLPKGASRKDAQ